MLFIHNLGQIKSARHQHIIFSHHHIMARLNTQTVFENRYALVDHVQKFELEEGFVFTIKRSNNTRTLPRVELGMFFLAAHFNGESKNLVLTIIDVKSRRVRLTVGGKQLKFSGTIDGILMFGVNSKTCGDYKFSFLHQNYHLYFSLPHASVMRETLPTQLCCSRPTGCSESPRTIFVHIMTMWRNRST